MDGQISWRRGRFNRYFVSRQRQVALARTIRHCQCIVICLSFQKIRIAVCQGQKMSRRPGSCCGATVPTGAACGVPAMKVSVGVLVSTCSIRRRVSSRWHPSWHTAPPSPVSSVIPRQQQFARACCRHDNLQIQRQRR